MRSATRNRVGAWACAPTPARDELARHGSRGKAVITKKKNRATQRGAVVPIDSRQRPASSDMRPDRLEFELWPGSGEGTVVEDAGEGDGWRRGEIARTRISQQLVADTATVVIGATQGRFPGLPARRPVIFHLRCCAEPTAVTGVEGAEYHYDVEQQVLTVMLPAELICKSRCITITGVTALPKEAPVSTQEKRVVFVPSYDRRKARRSLGSALLLPPPWVNWMWPMPCTTSACSRSSRYTPMANPPPEWATECQS